MERLLPVTGRLPVTWQTRDMSILQNQISSSFVWVLAPRQALQPVIAVQCELSTAGPNAKPEILKGGVVYADSAMCSSPEQTKIPKDRQFGAKSSHVRQRYIRTAADNQMIKHAYIHESTTFYHPFGNQSVGLTWLRATGGMIMRKDHGGVHFDGFAYTRGCTSTWLRVPEKDDYVSTPGSDYLKDHHKDLALLFRQLAL